MSTALVAQSQFPGAAEWDSMKSVAGLLARSEAVRDCFRGKPENVIVALMVSRDLQISPTLALQSGFVVHGKFDLEVSVKLAIIQSRLPDFDYEVDEWHVEGAGVNADGLCRLTGGVKGKNPKTVEYSIQMAKDARIFKDTWLAHPKDMLFYKAMKRLIMMTSGAALYQMPVLFTQDADEVTVATEPSGAVVVQESPVTPPPVSEPVEIVSNPVPVDEMGRLMALICEGWKTPPMPEHKNGRAKWLKTHAEVITRVCNLFYEEKGESKVVGFGKVEPLDYPRISKWLEDRDAKGAGVAVGEDATEVTDDPPAVDAGLPEDDAPQAAEEVIVPVHERLKNSGSDNVVSVLLSLRLASKGALRYVEESQGKYGLVHLPFLTKLGYEKGQWMATIEKDSNKWDLLARAIVDECYAKNVTLSV